LIIVNANDPSSCGTDGADVSLQPVATTQAHAKTAMKAGVLELMNDLRGAYASI
jgi:hypothetical protein